MRKTANKTTCDEFADLQKKFSVAFATAQREWVKWLRNYPNAGTTQKEWSAWFKTKPWYHPGDIDGVYVVWKTVFPVLQLALECKNIPPKKQKKIEALYKSLISRRSVRVVEFFATHYEALYALADADTWPNTGEDEGMKVGGFTLVNQTKADPAPVIKTLELADKLIRQSDIPNVKSVLYGPVVVATKLQGKANVAAFYAPKQDTIYIQSLKSFSHMVERTLLHEIGHRYFDKFSKPEARKEWLRHHNEVGGNRKKLEPGSIVNLSGKEYEFHAREIINGKMYAALKEPGKEGLVGHVDYATASRGASYPTSYAGKDYEEHFCEAFAMYLLGTLQPEHFAAFERIWVNG